MQRAYCVVILLVVCLFALSQAKRTFSQVAGDSEIEEVIRKTYSTQVPGRDNGDCRCSRQQCGCCVRLDIAKIHLRNTACLNLTYLPHDIGVALTLSFDNRVVKTWQISIKNPPPLCFDLVDMDGAKICIELYDLNLVGSTFSGCARLKASISFIKIKAVELGCWHMPLSKDMVNW